MSIYDPEWAREAEQAETRRSDPFEVKLQTLLRLMYRVMDLRWIDGEPYLEFKSARYTPLSELKFLAGFTEEDKDIPSGVETVEAKLHELEASHLIDQVKGIPAPQPTAPSATTELLRQNGMYATRAEYLPSGHIRIYLANGFILEVPKYSLQRLRDASSSDLHYIEISPSGEGLHWPALDWDVHVPSLLKGHTGSQRWMAQHKS
jgi:hypothetical protein